MKIKSILDRMLSMSENAWFFFIRSLQMSCVLLFCAWMLLLPENMPYSIYQTAMEMAEMPKVILLIGLILSVCVEDIECRRR